jgi:hypothetical protein
MPKSADGAVAYLSRPVIWRDWFIEASPLRRPAPLRVLAQCPQADEPVATHAAMSRNAFAKLKADICFYCARCRGAHVVAPGHLWLEGDPPPASGGDTS